jgi:hypothetical protein
MLPDQTRFGKLGECDSNHTKLVGQKNALTPEFSFFSFDVVISNLVEEDLSFPSIKLGRFKSH